MSQYSVADMMVVAIARRLKNNEKVFHGVASPVPMVATMLAKNSYAPKLVYLNIAGGVNTKPKKLEKSTDGPELIEGCASMFTLTDIFDLSARGELDVAFLSGVQIDVKGRLNVSAIGDFNKPKVRLPGGAGSAVLVPTVKKAFIWRTKHNKRTFVEKCDFVTTQGNIEYIFTPLCIFKKDEEGLKLDRIFKNSSLEEIIENTGFEIRYDEIVYEKEPTKEEMDLLDKIDPEKIREIEF